MLIQSTLAATPAPNACPFHVFGRFVVCSALLLAWGWTLLYPTAGFAAGKANRESLRVKAHLDLPYYGGPDAHKKKHKLDLFLPEGKKKFPTLFFVHGGAWRKGDKSFLGAYSALGRFYARHGIAAVIINYRLSPAVKHPAHIKDVARAFAWTYKNIARYGGDPQRIFVCGHSAGGHLVSLLAVNERFLKAHRLTASIIRGVIPISGVYQIPEKGLASVFGKAADARKDASPQAHARKNLPPFLVLYADSDYRVCGKEPSEAFASALKEKNNKVKTEEIKDSNHFTIIIKAGLPRTPVSRTILDFIIRHASK